MEPRQQSKLTEFIAKLTATCSVYSDLRVVAILFLGFSAGLPFLLVFSTLSAWLSQAEIERAAIGMMAWVGLAYTVKFFWAPIVDRLRLPILTRIFGRRRSWLLLSQCCIIIGLTMLAQQSPDENLKVFALIALFIAFSSATQDIVVDAWRIEIAPQSLFGAMAAAYQLGYRIAIVVAGAGALWLAASFSWAVAYQSMAGLMILGVICCFLIKEPKLPKEIAIEETMPAVSSWIENNKSLPASLRTASEWVIKAVICPFVDFIQRFGWKNGLFILVFAGLYRMTDFTMGVMANPFYLEMGFTLKEIAAVVKGAGIFSQIFGTILGGIMVARLGLFPTLKAGIILVLFTNFGFFALSVIEDKSLISLACVVAADNIAMGVSGTALIAYLSSLTSSQYTATQYALFSSFYALPGKIVMGFSGFVVDAISWPSFFIYTSMLGVPSLILVFILSKRNILAPETQPTK